MQKSYTVAGPILRHFRRTARDLPWRDTRDPYAVLVSEVMLQQTQVSRVVPAYARFLRRFPTLATLRKAPLGAVLREWSGLGYNRRARALHRIAQACPDGLPADVASLDALPGIGAYTAGAVACFAYGAAVPFADVNIKRVLGRIFLGRVATEREAIALDLQQMPERGADLWHHALMDLGATICVATNPRCEVCPLAFRCAARGPGEAGDAKEAQDTVASRQRTGRALRPAAYRDSDRRVRGAIVRVLAKEEAGLTIRSLEHEIGDPRVPRLADALVSDGLIERAGRRFRLPI
ncbi:MAG TPA: A/G-specific adenine glycosylase [Candidatus Limnocylindria bacterium]|nr:A/G-specific adenine glycosylase [Candidatus Limnocylindria bacterium]